MRREIVKQIAEADPEREAVEPDDISDFGFYYPVSYVSQVVQFLKLSNYCFWPREGGLDNQDAHLIDDVQTWLRLEDRLRYEYKSGEWRGPGEKKPKGYNPLALR